MDALIIMSLLPNKLVHNVRNPRVILKNLHFNISFNTNVILISLIITSIYELKAVSDIIIPFKRYNSIPIILSIILMLFPLP
jgi:hypothetical protein